MRGIRIEVGGREAGAGALAFRRVFKPVRGAIDARCWWVSVQPWMGLPAAQQAAFERTVLATRPRWAGWLWERRAVWAYAPWFNEEEVDLWGFPPSVSGGELVAAIGAMDPADERAHEAMADIHLRYVEGRHWDVRASDGGLLDALRAYAEASLGGVRVRPAP